MIEVVEKYGGQIKFVQLICPTDKLLERVNDPSRQAYDKIVSEEFLSEFVGKYDFIIPYPERESLIIDTPIQSAEQSAAHIINHLQLTKQVPESS